MIDRSSTHRVLRIALLMFIIGFGQPLLALEGEAGQPGGFLTVGIGARALALGNAYVAVPSGPETSMWNPANLALLPDSSFESSVSNLSLDRQFDDAALAVPIEVDGKDWGNWSLTWLDFSLGNDFEGRQTDTSSYYNFADTQSAYVISSGHKISNWLAVGAGVEYIQDSIDIYRASGFGLNMGFLVTPSPKIHVGVSVSQVLSQITWTTGYSEQFPWTVRVGASGTFLQDWLLLTVQSTAEEGLEPVYEAGAEVRYHGLLAGRIGINENGYTLGGGVSVEIFKTHASFDYALAPDALEEGYTQRFSLGLVF